MRCLWITFVTAVCFLFLLKLKWPKNTCENIYKLSIHSSPKFLYVNSVYDLWRCRVNRIITRWCVQVLIIWQNCSYFPIFLTKETISKFCLSQCENESSILTKISHVLNEQGTGYKNNWLNWKMRPVPLKRIQNLVNLPNLRAIGLNTKAWNAF